MRPARSSGNFRLPQIRSAAAKLALALVAGSLVFAIGRLMPLLLSPEAVLRRLMLWQPVSYAFISTSPLGVIFGALIIWSIGGALEMTWGARRLVTFAVGSTVLAGILTVLLSLVLAPLLGRSFEGGTVMTTAVWIAYGLSMGRAQTNFWGIPLTGNMFAVIGLGFIVLNGAFAGFLQVIPDLFAAGMAYAYVHGFSPRVLWLKFQTWRIQRQLKGRSKHLKLISRDRNMPTDSDRYLH